MKTNHFLLIPILAISSLQLSAKNTETKNNHTKETFQTAIQDSNTYITGDSLIKLGTALHDIEKYDEAIEKYKRVNSNDENYHNSLYELALSYYSKGEKEKALEILKETNPLDASVFRSHYYNLYGSILDDLGRSNEAIQLFESIYDKYKNSYLIPYNYALSCFNYGDLEKARIILERNVRINPFHFGSNRLLGHINYAQGRLIPALLCYSHCAIIAADDNQSQTAFLNFTDAISGELTSQIEESKKWKCATSSADDEINKPFKELEFFIKDFVVRNNQFKAKTKLRFNSTNQLQFLLENVTVDSKSENIYSQLYIPLCNEIVRTKNEEACIYNFTRFSSNENVHKLTMKNKKSIETFLKWAVIYINEGRTKLFDPSEKYRYTFYHGNIESKGQYSDAKESVKTGTWISYNRNGIVSEQSTYHDNLLNGPYTSYFEDGSIEATVNFKNGEKDGKYTRYHKNGAVRQTGTYTNGKENGEVKIMDESGNIALIIQTKDGNINGKYTSFYGNGDVYYYQYFTNGKQDGKFEVFYPNKTLMKKGEYKDDEYDGEISYYYENGAKRSIENYSNKKQNGIQTEWYADGKIKCEYNTQAGAYVGSYKYYYNNGVLSDSILYDTKGALLEKYNFDKNGVLLNKYTYKKDIPNTESHFDKSGKLISTEKKNGKDYSITIFGENHQKSEVKRCNEKGINGTSVSFDYYGNKSGDLTYVDGVLSGPVIAYYPQTGQKKSDNFYINGKNNAHYTSYFRDGQIETDGYMVENKQEGPWTYYYGNGKTQKRIFFKKGQTKGKVTDYTFEGKKDMEVFYDDDNRLVKSIYYDENENVIDSCVMAFGSGHYLLKHPNGKIAFECKKVENGMFYDSLKTYNKNGVLLYEGNRINGKNDGRIVWYDNDGRKTDECNFILGKEDGESIGFYPESGKIRTKSIFKLGTKISRTDYHENGKISFETNYNEDSEREGWSSKYDNAGNLMYKLLCYNGIIIGYAYADNTGKLTTKMLEAGTNKLVAYYPNGKKSMEGTVSDGWREGLYKEWDINGNIRKEYNFKNDEYSGTNKEYNANGTLALESNYLYNNLNGISKRYSNNGILLSEESYSNDLLHGTCKYYNSKRQLRLTRVYDNNRLISEKKGR